MDDLIDSVRAHHESRKIYLSLVIDTIFNSIDQGVTSCAIHKFNETTTKELIRVLSSKGYLVKEDKTSLSIYWD